MSTGEWILECFRNKKSPSIWWIVPLIVLWVLALCSFFCYTAHAEVTEASYYTRASCIKESGQAVMANGKELDDGLCTAASWDYKFGKVLLVTNVENGKAVRVVCTDRGPAKRLYRLGRKLDLSKKAFSSIADIKQGIIKVNIKEV